MKSRSFFLNKNITFVLFVLFRSLVAMEAPMPPSSMGEAVPEVSPEVSEEQAALNLTEEVSGMEDAEQAPLGADTEGYLEKEIGSQGNWVKKREWLKESQKMNDEIQGLVVVVQELRKSFYDKFSVIDNELDVFYKKEGFEQGKVQTLFDDLEKYLEKKRKKKVEALKTMDQQRGVTGEYEIKLDMLEDEVKSQRTDLDQLKLDMKSISDLDKSLDERLKVLDQQINIALEESAKARKLTNKIWYIIDDKKARAVYYELKGNILERVKNIQNYIQQDLTSNFDNVINVIRTQIGKVSSGIKNLENQGFIIKDRAKRVEELKLKQLEQLQSGKKEEVEIKKEDQTEVQISWTDKVYNFVVDVVARTYSWINSFFKSQKDIKKVKKTKIVEPKMEEQETIAAMPTPPKIPVQMQSNQEMIPMPTPPAPAIAPNNGMSIPQAPSMGMQSGMQ